MPGEEPREDPLPHPVAPTRTTAPAGGHGAPSRSSCRSRSTGSAAAAVCRLPAPTLPAPTLAGVSRGAWAPIRGAFEGPARSGLGSHADSGGHGGLQGRPPADSTGGRPHLHPESSPAPPCKGARACSWPVPRCFSEAHPLGHWLLTYRLGTLRLGLPSLAPSSGGKGGWEIGQRAFVPPERGAGLSPVRWGADAQADNGLPVPGANRTSQSKVDTASRIPDAPGQVGRAVPRAGACVGRLSPRRLGDSDLEP